MARTRVVFYCTECGNDTPRWQGQCPACRGWNTLVEERAASRGSGARRPHLDTAPAADIVRLDEIESSEIGRWTSGIEEFDFVLGGGIVPGSIVLIGGEPGIGKSTLLLQVAGRLAEGGHAPLYLTGEESPAQVRLRADRIEEETGSIAILAETELGAVLERIEKAAPAVLLVDSIQTVYAGDVEGVPGSVSQVRECAARFHRYAKESGTAVFLVGHVTKGGGIAGPKTLEHIVDTVLYFEGAGGADHRILRATKNRFGSVDEIGVFRMTGGGLVPVVNPSELFLGERGASGSGSVVTATMEGSRPLLTEIQALATRASYGAPQRVAAGIDHKRLALLIAVLEKRAGIPFGQLDTFLNVAGGLRIAETGVDAAVAVALASAARDLPVGGSTIVVGEVGLGGELRPVGRLERRLAEAARMGFTRAFVPGRSAQPAPAPGDVEIRPVANVSELIGAALG
jgi:DNA repair protein RadA/Sms